MKKLSLLLISTYNVGLLVWKKTGLYDREIEYYRKMGEYLKGFGIMAYDKTNEKPANENYQYYYNQYGIPNFLFSILWPFLHFKAVKEYDVIKTNQFCGAWVALLIKLLHKEKIFVLRGGYAWIFKRKWLKILTVFVYLTNYFCMKFADLIFFVSLKDRDEYLRRYGKKHLEKCRILPNSIDTDLFKPNNRAVNGEFHITMAGRLIEMKNFHSALAAISNLSEELKRNVFVDIIGEGDYSEKLKSIAQKRGVNCRFWGALPNNKVAEILSNSDIYIMPQVFGSGMSKGILEAMAAGNVVLASDIEAHRNTIHDKVDGFLCGTDIASIQKKLDYVISHFNDNEIRAVRERAVKKARQSFSMAAIVAKEYQFILQTYNSRFQTS